MTQLQNTLHRHNYRVFCVTETLLKENHELRRFPNYNFLRNDIKMKGHRGIGIFVRNDITFKPINYHPKCNNNIEYQILKMQINKTKSMIVACIYRHPIYSAETLKNDYEFFHDLFAYLISLKLIFYVLGDFNLKEKFIKPLVSVTDGLSIKQLVTVPTRQQNILDLIFTNDCRTIQTNVFDGSLADHAITDIIIKSINIKAESRTLYYRNYKNICVQSLIVSINNQFLYFNPNESNFTMKLLAAFNKHAPVIMKHVKMSRKNIYVSN